MHSCSTEIQDENKGLKTKYVTSNGAKWKNESYEVLEFVNL